MAQHIDIDVLVELWAKRIRYENIGIGYPSKTMEGKMMTCNVSYPRVLLIPEYWPDRRLMYLNEEISRLESKLSNPIVSLYVLEFNISDVAKICKCTRTTARNRIHEGKQILLNNIRKYL